MHTHTRNCTAIVHQSKLRMWILEPVIEMQAYHEDFAHYTVQHYTVQYFMISGITVFLSQCIQNCG